MDSTAPRSRPPKRVVTDDDTVEQPDRTTKVFKREPEDSDGRSGVVATPEIRVSCNEANNDDDESTEYSGWKTLASPPLKRIFTELRTNEECSDLAALTLVSKRFDSCVRKFMMTDANRPGVKKVVLRSLRGVLNVFIDLYPANLPFHNRENWIPGRFKFFPAHSSLGVALSGIGDPMTEQVAYLLSTSIQKVFIDGVGLVSQSSAEMRLCERLLRGATIKQLDFDDTPLDDVTAPLIISIVSRASRFTFHTDERPATRLTDPADFITRLCATTVSHVEIYNDMNTSTSMFFGLPHAFWNNFFSEKLTDGSFARIEAGGTPGKKKWDEAPVTLPNSLLYWVHWE